MAAELVSIGGKDYTVEEMRVLAKAGVFDNIGQKHDTSSSTPTAAPTHGPFPGNANQFGILSGAGVRPGFWNATPRVRSISQYIPMFKTVINQELIDVATGVSSSGSVTNQTSACVVGPKPGQLLGARISAAFGIIHESTKIFDVTQAGLRRNRADIDRTVFNDAVSTNPWLPNVPGIDGSTMLDRVLMAELFALGIDLERNVSQVHFTGVQGTSNNTYAGIATQWNGLDSLIKTGWTDSVTGAAVTGLDATVQAWNQAIGATDATTSRNIISALIDTYYGQKERLQNMGITPVFALVMRPDLFRAIANIWACAYGVDRCAGSAGNNITRSQEVISANFDSIMANQSLPMDGDLVPVLLDDAIIRDTLGNNYFKSDIYGVCLTANGRPTLYGEYFDMNNPEATEIINFGGMPEGSTTTVNDGMYRVFKRVTGGCFEYDFFARPRLITDAPFAHFRFDDVFYRADYKQQDAIPGFSYFNASGYSYRV